MKLDLQPLIHFMEHLPKNGDMELGILKCHLLIEELLLKELKKCAKEPKFIEKMNPRFAQKVDLVKAFSDFNGYPWIWEALKKLNKARNELVHGLSAAEIFDRVEEFVTFVEKNTEPPKAEVLSLNFGRFHWAAFQVYNIISAHVHFDPASIRTPTFLSSLKIKSTEQKE